jgi:hypothetical protein
MSPAFGRGPLRLPGTGRLKLATAADSDTRRGVARHHGIVVIAERPLHLLLRWLVRRAFLPAADLAASAAYRASLMALRVSCGAVSRARPVSAELTWRPVLLPHPGDDRAAGTVPPPLMGLAQM